MKRTVLALLLCFALSAAGAAAGDLFPAGDAYPGYADVAESDWFYENAVLCYETGLMTGSDKGFEPYREMTLAEASAMAARLREALSGKPIPAPEPQSPWYRHYVDYLQDAALESGSSYYGLLDWAALSERADRQDFLVLLALAVDGRQEDFPAINAVTALPDVTNDNVVFFFYNAGILTGTDKYGTFDAGKGLTRAEGAAMLSRVVRPELRREFVPADYDPFTAAELKPTDVLFTNGVTAEAYLNAVLARIEVLEAACAAEGTPFNWFNTVDGALFLDDVKNGALDDLGVAKDMGTALYETFDLQVFYSRYLDLKVENIYIQ